MEGSPHYASLWWKDICNLDGFVTSFNWLEEAFVRKLGNGMLTRFWKDVWFGNEPLCLRFPRMFSLSMEKEAFVGELLKVEGDRRWWNFSWRRNLFQWEFERVTFLVEMLVNVRLSHELDSWRWSFNTEAGFSVKSAYDAIMEYGGDLLNLTTFEEKIFSSIWESPAPSKVMVFSWQLLHDRLPTKVNLARRGVLGQEVDGKCVWCDHSLEAANHLFLHCNVAHRVWIEIFNWLGVLIVMPPNILFDILSESVNKKNLRRGVRLVWHTTVWSLWIARNNVIFNGIVKEPLEIVEEIKVLS
jgi:hypothetical protein